MIDITDIQETNGEYHEQLYANQLENMKEVGKCLETYNQLKLNYENIENLIISITSNEIKSLIKSLSTTTKKTG